MKLVFPSILLLFALAVKAQQTVINTQWIRPYNGQSSPVWGLHNGIVVGLWPASLDGVVPGSDGGPRGLLRIGYDYKGVVYLINFIAVEPVVNGDMEFSEVSPSAVDGKLGKQFWSADSVTEEAITPASSARGIITHPDSLHPETEQLSLYVLMEKFIDGAHPYLKLTIRSDRPGELVYRYLTMKKVR